MPHAVANPEFTPDEYPPFPAGLPTVELETISLSKLLAGDKAEQDRVFAICQGRGFFYLELAGSPAGDTIAQGARDIAQLGTDVFRMPLDDKMQYRGMAGGSSRSIFGYKYAGATLADKATGVRDTAEFFNVSKDDMVAPTPADMERAWPPLIMERRDLFRDYVTAAHGVGMLILGLLVERLGVDRQEIWNRHRLGEKAGDHVRITRGPPRDKEEMPEIQTPSHTDFGTITLLMNWLGGLQVWSESARAATLNDGQPDVPGEWLWVVPKRGCAIINLGDAAVKFTNGAFCSGRHRVIPSPGVQGRYPRYSLVYFVRPEDKVIMEALKGPGIPAAPEKEGGEEKLTADEWIFRQTAGLGWKLGDKATPAQG